MKRQPKGGACMLLDISKAFDKDGHSYLHCSTPENGISPSFDTTPTPMCHHGTISNSCQWRVSGEHTRHKGSTPSPYPLHCSYSCKKHARRGIQTLVQHKQIQPIHPVTETPAVCHLMFADDIQLFLRTQPRELRALWEMLPTRSSGTTN